ncbi:ankyrin repeat family protein [Tanacetum coccineum]
MGSTDTADIENNSLAGGTDTADIENNSLGGTDTAVVENQETPKRRCLHDVPHVKDLKDDKVKHNTTIKLLRRICEEVDRRNTSSDIQRLFSSPFCLAVENNTDEAIDVLTTYFRGLYNSGKDGHNIYQLTVLNRSEKVYIFIMNHKRDAISDLIMANDIDANNILHLAGRLAPIHKLNASSGAALQMQRELQWFEEVKRVVGIAHTRPIHTQSRRLSSSHAIVFAAAITVPGGNDSATGKPIYKTNSSLIIFAISDAISLFTSTTSLLFRSILTARYADEDFLYKLLKRLIFSLFPLLVELISSTYGSGIFTEEKEYRQSSANANKKKKA